MYPAEDISTNMDLLGKFFSSFKPVSEQQRMKTIIYRGGVVKFRIPAHWKEEYSDVDGGMLYEDRPNSGTLRLKIISLESPQELGSNAAAELLRRVDSERTPVLQPNGNTYLRYEQSASESGTRIKIHYWIIANPLPPRQARIATFSDAILEKHHNLRAVVRDLLMLETEVSAAEFSSREARLKPRPFTSYREHL